MAKTNYLFSFVGIKRGSLVPMNHNVCIPLPVSVEKATDKALIALALVMLKGSGYTHITDILIEEGG